MMALRAVGAPSNALTGDLNIASPVHSRLSRHLRHSHLENAASFICGLSSLSVAHPIRGQPMRSRRGSRRDANKGGMVPIRALDAAQPFDYEHRQKRQLEEKGRLNIGILGFGNFGQFLARRFARNGHRLTAWSRSDYSQVAKQMGVRFFTDMDDFCEEHPDVVLLCTSIISSDSLLRSLRPAANSTTCTSPPAVALRGVSLAGRFDTAGYSFDLYYGLFIYNTNATEELQRLEMAFDALKKQLLDQLHDVLRLQLFGMPPSATALPSSSPPSSSSSHSSSSRAFSPSPLTSPVPRSPTSEQARPSSLPRQPSFPPPASGGVTRGAGNRSSSGNSSGSSSSGFESEGEEWRPEGAAHSQVFVDQEVPGGVVIDGASAAVYSFGDSTESSESEEESGGNGKGKAESSQARRR
ncbi:unnamed protein product [Closterium sp. NIES-54]